MKINCSVCKTDFTITEEETVYYQQLSLPLPTICPTHRQQRRIAYRNFRSLYHHECDATGKNLISMYDADSAFPVYDNKYWWSDAWSADSYGIDYNPDLDFFSQYEELNRRVPRFAIMNLQSENCDYSNFTFSSKDCYLVFGCVYDENCLYGHIVWESEYCVDNLYVYRSKWCSNSIDLVECYDVHYSTESANCSESYFLHDCRNCQNCFGGVNLRNKQYVFFNEQLTKEEYQARINNLQPLSRTSINNGWAWLEEERQKAIYPPFFGLRNEDVSGNHIFEAKSTFDCYDIKKAEDSRYCYTVLDVENCYDCSFSGGPMRFCVECLTVARADQVAYSHMISDCNNIMYSEFCYGSHDLFGCNGLRNASYCILNKQYSKDDYFALRAKIIEDMKETNQWGEFFPIESSPFAYNEAIVGEYFPLEKENVVSRAWKWKDKTSDNSSTSNPTYAPERMTDVEDSILENPLSCAKTGKPYRITKAELSIHRKLGLPLPNLCPDERHDERMNYRTSHVVQERNCTKCSSAITTTYALEPNVYCEKCYLEFLR